MKMKLLSVAMLLSGVTAYANFPTTPEERVKHLTEMFTTMCNGYVPERAYYEEKEEPSKDDDLAANFEKFNNKDHQVLLAQQENEVVLLAQIMPKILHDKYGYHMLFWQGLLSQTAERVVEENSEEFEKLISEDEVKRGTARNIIALQMALSFECAYYGPSKGCQGIGWSGYLGGEYARWVSEQYHGKWNPFDPVEKEEI